MSGAPAAERPAEDLTARARIRDAAIALFSERGLQATTIRDVARAAGVSAALVRHHFGAKDGLREACDTYVVDRFAELRQQALDDLVGLKGHLDAEGPPPGGLYGTYQPAMLPLMRYLARAMVDGSPGAATIFDRLVERAEGWLAAHRPDLADDARAVAAVIIAQSAGLNLLHAHVSRALGVDVLTPQGHPRMAAALFALYSHPLLDAGTAAAGRASMERYRTEPAPGTGADRPDDRPEGGAADVR